MKLIVGLGNPGSQYDGTRHNLGFFVVDALRERWDFPAFTMEEKFQAALSAGRFEGEKILLVKPQTCVNLSSESVQTLLHFYKLTPADLIVIQDELDLPLGKYKIATDSSSAGHNGITNIIEGLGTQTFTRLRVGIAATEQSAECLKDAHDFVLSRFNDSERSVLEDILPNLLTIIEKLVAEKK